MLRNFKVLLDGPVALYCNNKLAIQMLENSAHHEKTKHIDIDYHFARHHVITGFVKPLVYRPLGPTMFNQLVFTLNMGYFIFMSSLKKK